MNNEPVAWIKLDEVREHFKSVGCGTVYKTGGEGRVPVYIHPVKELTNEEIMESCHAYHYTFNFDYLGFARAILRKASEK